MLKIGLTAVVTATLCFALTATTGFASQSLRVIPAKLGDVFSLTSANVQCQVITKKQLACGRNKLAGQLHVFFEPNQLNVVRFNAAGTKYSLVYQMKR